VSAAHVRGVPAEHVLRDAQDFSLVLGGPLFQLFRRAHLSDDALLLVRQRVVFIALLGWLPLFALTAAEGNLVGGATLPFLKDLEVHVRFLVVVPLLIVAELVVHQRLHPIATTFLQRHLIPESALERFDKAISEAFRWRNSTLGESLLMAIVYGVGVLYVWRQYMAFDVATWYAKPGPGGSTLTAAGMWFGYVSLPMFQFLLIRWYFRLLIWTRFLWHVSRIQLCLVPAHPDRLAGLGFLSSTVHAFGLLLLAHGALLAGNLANRIFFLGASLVDFKYEIAVMVGFLLCVVLLPLLVFTPQLASAKRVAVREYGTLAERYVREFDAKWLRGQAPGDEPLVGSADIQSLADLANSYEVVRGMRLAPVTRDALIQLAATAAAPLLPLTLTMMPLEELLKRLAGLLF